jgi:hypothetical protein
MKSTATSICVKFAACMLLVVGVSVSALASCGDSLSAMAVKTTAITGQHSENEQDSQSYARHPGNSSIVGLWHVEFKVNGQTIQEAYQLWNAGGTEVHNPNVDPRGAPSAWGYGLSQAKLTPSPTASGTTTRPETSWEPSTSARRLRWARAAIHIKAPSRCFSMTPRATSLTR